MVDFYGLNRVILRFGLSAISLFYIEGSMLVNLVLDGGIFYSSIIYDTSIIF